VTYEASVSKTSLAACSAMLTKIAYWQSAGLSQWVGVDGLTVGIQSLRWLRVGADVHDIR
jgi:hypothetical protein